MFNNNQNRQSILFVLPVLIFHLLQIMASFNFGLIGGIVEYGGSVDICHTEDGGIEITRERDFYPVYPFFPHHIGFQVHPQNYQNHDMIDVSALDDVRHDRESDMIRRIGDVTSGRNPYATKSSSEMKREKLLDHEKIISEIKDLEQKKKELTDRKIIINHDRLETMKFEREAKRIELNSLVKEIEFKTKNHDMAREVVRILSNYDCGRQTKEFTIKIIKSYIELSSEDIKKCLSISIEMVECDRDVKSFLHELIPMFNNYLSMIQTLREKKKELETLINYHTSMIDHEMSRLESLRIQKQKAQNEYDSCDRKINELNQKKNRIMMEISSI